MNKALLWIGSAGLAALCSTLIPAASVDPASAASSAAPMPRPRAPGAT